MSLGIPFPQSLTVWFHWVMEQQQYSRVFLGKKHLGQGLVYSMFKVPEIFSFRMGWGLLSQRGLLMLLPDPGPSLTSHMETEGPRGG